MIRWKGVIFLGVVIGLILLLSLISTDRWLENQLEKAGSQIVGAKVEIDGLDFSLFGARLSLKRLQVTDPKQTMRNLFETGVCRVDFEFWPLLSKKIIVENFQISGLQTYTPRETDGALPRRLKEKEKKPGLLQKSLQKVAQNIQEQSNLPLSTIHKQVNVDSVVKLLTLKSPHKIDSLQKALNQSLEDWQQKLAQSRYQKELKAIETEIKGIDPQKIKDLKSLQKALRTLKASRKKVAQLTDSISTTKKELQQTLEHLRQSIPLIQQWIEEDYRQALKKARLPELSRKNMAKMVFGATLVNRFEQYLTYLQTGRTYLNKVKSDKPKKEKVPRLKGQDIYFYSPNGRPDWWIKKILLSGQTNDGLQLSGQLNDLTSDQRYIQRPTLLNISGQSANARSFRLTGSLNYLQKIPHETFSIDYAGFSLNHTRLSNSAYLPVEFEKGVGYLKGKIDFLGDTVLSEISFEAREMSLARANVAKLSDLQKLVLEAIQQISTLNLKARIKGQPGKWDLHLNSNLDDLLLAQFRKKLSAELSRAQSRLRSEIQKKVNPAHKRFLAFVEQKEQWVQNLIQQHEKELKRMEAEVKKRQDEINRRIEAEKKKAGKQIQKKLKSLFQ